MAKKNVAELALETLARAGVERIYAVAGDRKPLARRSVTPRRQVISLSGDGGLAIIWQNQFVPVIPQPPQ
jgi:hypothetical protein